MKISAVVVTYNRKSLLAECLSALHIQSRPVDEIVLIDNASTDGTYDFIKEQGLLSKNIIYKRLESNVGGAGGFYAGMRVAYENGADWLWIMDDDTIPCADALEKLLDALEDLQNEKVSYLASSVFGSNGEAMNVPNIDDSGKKGQYSDWYRYLGSGIVRIDKATFVSLLINREAVQECGFPCKDYFIWGDDTEYTIRITKRFGSAFFIGKSKVIHKRTIAKPVFITDEVNMERMKMHYYFVRNSLINTKEYSGKRACYRAMLSYLHVCWTILIHKNMKKAKLQTIIKALRDYALKKYDVNAFNNRYQIDGQES